MTAVSRKLLQYWADPSRENRVLFCQREAAETAIFLTEVAGRHGYTDWGQRLEPENEAHNNGLPRMALKMATGSGKTVVMLLTEVRERIAAAGESLRTNSLPRLLTWCQHCDRCDLAAICRDQPRIPRDYLRRP